MADLLIRIQAALTERYAVQRELGRGAMATVYLAEDLKHHRRVAIKILRPELAATLGRERFLREIEVAAGLDHPHILPLYDSGEADGFLYYVMPYMEGASLRDRLNREQQLSLEDALGITQQVAGALGYAHSRGVVHRDIKPENLLLAQGGARVADFGIARAIAAAAEDNLTGTGVAIGTPAYMSPEQAAGSGELDGRSDLYSLGCVLYEMLAGEPPFTGANVQEVIAKRWSDPAPRISEVRPVPSVVERALEGALATSPADRWATVEEFMVALKQTATTGPPWSAAVLRMPRPLRRGLSIAALLLALGFSGWWIIAGSRTRPGDFRSIAVLPCENLTRDTSQAYIADRWSEELIDKLSRVAALRARSWLSMRQYKETPKNSRQIAGEVGAGTLVRCRVAESADSLRLGLQLIGASRDQILWSDDYARPLNAMAINAVQAEAARKIAGVLGVTPSPSERIQLDRPLTQDPEALKQYRLARYFHGLPTGRTDDVRKSIAHYQQAIARDSLFAAAYVGLADITWVGAGVGRPPREWVPQILQLVLRAIQIDPTLAEAHTLLASYLLAYNYDWPSAEREHRRAVELNPNSVLVRTWRGMDLAVVGHYDAAVAELEKAVELDPAFSLARIQLISALRVARQYDRARKEVRAALEINPQNSLAYMHLGLLLLQMGKADSAVAEMEKGAQLGFDARAWVGDAYGVVGRREKARQMLRSLLRDSVLDLIGIARVHAGLGEKDEAMRWLQRAYEERDLGLLVALGGFDPGFHSLRSEPPFQALRRRVGLDKW